MAIHLEASGGKHRVRPVMNVTPLVDVVLVLLIIFMVVTPLLNKQFWVHVPEKKTDNTPSPSPDNPPVVLRLGRDGNLRLNAEAIDSRALPDKLKRVFAAKSDHTLFFDADEHAPYGAAVEALDLAREGGAMPIAVLPSH